MKKVLSMVTLLAGSLATVSATAAADLPTYRETTVYTEPDAVGGVRIGYLACDIGGGIGYLIGSAKTVDCVFHSSNGRHERYTGTIRKLGVDVGFTTRGRLVWAVFAPTAGYHHGSLSGIYDGATVEATVGAGVGAHVLVGGTSGSIHLQTISVQGQLGLNAAATGTSMTLNSVG
jgi:hypothetical protein